MRALFETIGTFIVSLFLMAIPVLCTLSFVYNWFLGINFFLCVACVVEWLGVISVLIKLSDMQDKR